MSETIEHLIYSCNNLTSLPLLIEWWKKFWKHLKTIYECIYFAHLFLLISKIFLEVLVKIMYFLLIE